MALTNMQLTAAEAKAQTICCGPDGDTGPRYPYGLSLSLDAESMAKLGMVEMPPVGAKLTLVATVEVTNVSQHQNQEKVDKSVGLQITDMDLRAPSSGPADRMFASMSKR